MQPGGRCFARWIAALAAVLTLLRTGFAASPLQSWKPDPTTGTSLAVVVPERAPLVHTAQVLADRAGKRTASGVARQTEEVLRRLDALLQSAGSGLQHAVRLHVALAEADALPEVQNVLARRFSGAHKPAASFVVTALPERHALVAVDAVALVTKTNAAELATRRDARLALLPSWPRLYVSGMADRDELLSATRKTLQKLTNAIGWFGLGCGHVVQLRVFLQPMSEAPAVQRVIADFFERRPPPVVLVEWLSTNPPVEIELIATIPPDTPHGGRPASDPDALRPVGFFTPPGTTDSAVFRRVARVNRGRLLYTSGLYGRGQTGSASEVREIFATLADLVRAHNSDLEHLVKATYLVSDDEAARQLNLIRPEFYHPKRAPAASLARVRSVGAPGQTVMVDMIAVAQ